MQESNQSQQEQVTQTEKNKMSPMIIIGIVIAIVILMGGLLLTRSQRNQLSEPQTQDTQMQDSVEADKTEEEINSVEEESMLEETTVIEVEGGAYYFDPNEIKVSAGTPVKVIFTNAGGMHDFVIDELEVNSKITQTGETVEVEFTPTVTGEFEYYCSVMNHRELGMAGTLIVE